MRLKISDHEINPSMTGKGVDAMLELRSQLQEKKAARLRQVEVFSHKIN